MSRSGHRPVAVVELGIIQGVQVADGGRRVEVKVYPAEAAPVSK